MQSMHVGLRTLAVPWPDRGADGVTGGGTGGGSFPLLVLYPALVPGAPTAFGSATVDLSANAAVAEGPAPLVVLSHGGGGAPQLYRALCMHLAQQGWIVAMPEHPGNNRRDNRLQGTAQNLADRPRHITASIDAVLADPALGPQADASRVAVIGHSMGGYTALAVAGGKPHTPEREPVPVTPDPRVRALVLLAPATAWFGAPDALRQVTVPILLLEAEHDDLTPAWQGQLVRDGVADPTLVQSRTVPGSGHFSFLSPFPPAMQRPEFPPANDPAGFDRAAFHRVLPAEVSGFLRQVLPA